MPHRDADAYINLRARKKRPSSLCLYPLIASTYILRLSSTQRAIVLRIFANVHSGKFRQHYHVSSLQNNASA